MAKLSLHVYAACLLAAALLPGETGAAGLGRLFFTPQERAQLDTLRDTQQEASYQPPAEEEEAQPLPQQFKLDGLVIRQRGNNTVWINGSPAPHPGIRIDAQNPQGVAVPIVIVNGETRVNIKPGQRVSTADGMVMEGYAGAPAPETPVAIPQESPPPPPAAQIPEKSP